MPKPDFDLIILEDVKNITINSDCTFTKHVIQKIKILTQKGMTAFSDQRFWYNTQSQNVEVLKAQTVTQDGRVIPITPHAVTDLLPSALAKAPGLCHVQEKLVCLIGIEINAVTELELKVTDNAPRSFFAGEELVEHYFPVAKKEFSVTIPEGMEFFQSYRKKPGGADFKPDISSANGMKTFKWSLKNVPAIQEAEYAPARQELASAIIFAANPQKAAGDFASRMNSAAGNMSKELKAKIRELVAGKKGIIDRVHAVYGYIQKCLNHIEISTAAAVETAVCIPRAASEIFMTHYANPVEKTVLLYAMLKTAGVKSEMAFGTDTEFAGTVLPVQFTRCGVIVNIGKKPVWLDTTSDFSKAKNTRPSGEIAVVKRDGFKITPAYPVASQENTADVRLVFAVDKDCLLEGTADLHFTGYFNPFWSLDREEKAVKDFIKQKLSLFGGKAEIKSLKVKGGSYPAMSVRAKFEITDCFKGIQADSCEQLVLKLPKFTSDLPEWAIVSGRNVPLKIASPCRIRESFAVSGPVLKSRAVFMPAQREIDTDTGTFTGRSSYKSGKAVYECVLDLREEIFPAARVDQAKVLIDAYSENRDVVMVK